MGVVKMSLHQSHVKLLVDSAMFKFIDVGRSNFSEKTINKIK